MVDAIVPAVSTRLARGEDKAGIWQLYEEALRPHIETIWGWDEDWQRANFDQALRDMATRVVEVDGRFAGYVQVKAEPGEDYLSMLILRPAFRSLGLGARLLASLLARSRGAGRGLSLRVFRTNASARRFYERQGWHVVADEGSFLLMRPGEGRHR